MFHNRTSGRLSGAPQWSPRALRVMCRSSELCCVGSTSPISCHSFPCCLCSAHVTSWHFFEHRKFCLFLFLIVEHFPVLSFCLAPSYPSGLHLNPNSLKERAPTPPFSGAPSLVNSLPGTLFCSFGWQFIWSFWVICSLVTCLSPLLSPPLKCNFHNWRDPKNSYLHFTMCSAWCYRVPSYRVLN